MRNTRRLEQDDEDESDSEYLRQRRSSYESNRMNISGVHAT
jgi:hypothetical protein